MTYTTGSMAYSSYAGLSGFSYSCISYLMDNDEIVWKLLRHESPDGWNEPDLTKAQKGEMIFKGIGNETNFRVFMDVGQPDAWTHEATIIRISPYDSLPDNRTIGTLALMFEVYSHYKLNHLSNYKTRVDWIAERFISVFNGALVGGVGRLNFNRIGTYEAKMMTAGQIPFKGKWILMGVKVT